MADHPIRQKPHRIVERVIQSLKQGIVSQYLFQLLMQFQCRQLQQSNRLLQLRRQGKMLRDAKLKCLFHADPFLLHSEVLAEIDAAYRFIGDNVVGAATGQDRTLINDIGMVANP